MLDISQTAYNQIQEKFENECKQDDYIEKFLQSQLVQDLNRQPNINISLSRELYLIRDLTTIMEVTENYNTRSQQQEGSFNFNATVQQEESLAKPNQEIEFRSAIPQTLEPKWKNFKR